MASQGIGRAAISRAAPGITRRSILKKLSAEIAVLPSKASALRRWWITCRAESGVASNGSSSFGVELSPKAIYRGSRPGFLDAAVTSSIISQATGSSTLSRFALPCHRCCDSRTSSSTADGSRESGISLGLLSSGQTIAIRSGCSRSACSKSVGRFSPNSPSIESSERPSRSSMRHPSAAAAMRNVPIACPTSCWQ